MTNFERILLARLMVFLMLVNIPGTFDCFLHVANICTTRGGAMKKLQVQMICCELMSKT